MAEDPVLDQVWQMLAHHAKGGDSPQQTLVRLCMEHLRRRYGWSLSKALGEDTLTAHSENWTTAQLALLWRAHQRVQVLGPTDLPIVVLRIGQVDFLIDGTTRINKRVAENAPGTHPVIVLEAEESVPPERPPSQSDTKSGEAN